MSEQNNDAATDVELITRAKAGEFEAFGELYRRYIALIYRYLRSRVSLKEEAEDLAEEVFLKAFQGLERYEERGVPYGAYLYRIARHTLVDYYRKRDSQPSAATIDTVEDDQSDPALHVDQREQFRIIAHYLGMLPQSDQEVIRLRLLLELSSEETGQWLGKRAGTVRVQLFRAIKKLRALMADDEQR